MKLAVLASAETWHVEDLKRAAQGRHRLQVVGHGRLSGGLGGFAPREDSEWAGLEEADAVLVRSMPPGTLEQVVFRMDMLAQWAARGKVVVNAPRAIEAAVDKYLAAARCQTAGLTVPPTLVCQTATQALAAFDELGRDVVIKPLFGGEGRGLCRVGDRELASRAFHTLERLGAVLYLQRFIEHEGCDLRLLVLGDRVFGMRRRNTRDWRTNISRGATAEPLEVDAPLREMALTAARAIGAELAGVDILPGRDGQFYLLEVNGVPGWKALSATLHIDLSAEILAHLDAMVRGPETFA